MRDQILRALTVTFDTAFTLGTAAALGGIVGLLLQQEAGVVVGAVSAIVGHTLRSVTVRLK